ncbi:MAG TPA: hypothetical protein VHS74_11730 [Solirubrobacterales bacterium]|nr:hypothetical protein [Solirubrobacterales bacterium]
MRLGFRVLPAVAVACGCMLLAAPAPAEVTRQGTLQASFNGGIAPQRLPRDELAPVTVQMGGRITTTDRTAPPKLERIVLEINSHGVLDNTGLPTCSPAKLNSLSSAAAEKACGGALVGHGNVTSRVFLPSQGAFASNGTMLAFNGRIHGRPAVLAQVASEAPLPLTYVIAFAIEKGNGTFGTSLVGTLPPIASDYGYISAFSLALSRRYTVHGVPHSFASASCPAPEGFPGATFPFAKAKYEFAGGISLGATLVRECKARN